jgi:hypothetical protein
MLSTATIEELPSVPDTLPPMPTMILASQPSRAAPTHTSVASFGKDGITYRKQPTAAQVASSSKSSSVWPSLQEAREICDTLKVPKSAKNLKPLEMQHLQPSTDPVVTARKYQKQVNQMKKNAANANDAYNARKAQLATRLSSPPRALTPVFDWREDADNYDNYEATFGMDISPYISTAAKDVSRDPSISLGETEHHDDPYEFDKSDSSDDDCPRQIGTLEMRMNMDVDDDIADAAGLSEKARGKQRERQVPHTNTDLILTTSQCTRRSTPAQATQEFLEVDYSSIMDSLVNSLSRIALANINACQCPKCERNELEQKGWILDSGASVHFTMSKNDFIDYQEVANAPIVQTASKKAQLQIVGRGAILLSHYIEDQGRQIPVVTRIDPVFHIPGLGVRLLSMGVFLKDDQEVQGNADKLVFYGTVSEKPLLVAYPSVPKTIYWVYVPDEIKASIADFTSIFKVDYDVWHKRFGHPSKDVLRRARKLKNFPETLEIPESSPPCKGCAEGKQHSDSFPKSQSRAKKPFDLVHSDLKELPVLSYSKFKYLVSFLDDHSSHAWVVLLKKKSDTLPAFKQFIAMVRTQFNATLKEFMSDFGGEYKSKEFDDFLKNLGILSRTSVPYMHQQNGRAERFNRTLMDKAQALRLQACLPQSWWEFAIKHATYLYNRTPIRRLEWRTPYELIYGNIPDVGHLRIFGCGAYVHIPPEVRINKLAPRSELMIFLGFVDGVKGYLFMKIPNNSLFTGVTAIFDEEMMPKCSTQKPRQFTPIGDKITRKEGPPIPKEAADEDPHPRRRSPSPIKRDDADHHDDEDRAPSPPRTPPRQQGQLPPAERQPPPPPRKSGRERKIPLRKDNVYGERRNPVDIERELKRPATGKDQGTSRQREHPVPNNDEQVPGPSSDNQSGGSGQDAPQDITEEHLAKLAKEGGVEFMNYLMAKAVPIDDSLPQSTREWTFRDILRMPKQQQVEWKKACLEELEALRKRQVFELTQLPPGRKAIKNRWVFDVKSDGRKRARLVAKGFSQVEGIDYDEIFSPVIRFETVRILFALAALEGWHISGLDVKTAFLYGKLDEEIYMEQPEGFKIKGKERMVLRLRRALYGLKQAALAWWRELVASLKELGFKRLYSDAGVFVYRHKDGSYVILLAYVDDILFVGPNQSFIQSKKQLFMTKWECRDLGDCKEFLRMRIRRSGKKILIDQCSYLQKVIERFGMVNAKYAQTPLPSGYRPTENQGEVDPQLRSKFQQIIGSLLYIMLGTRPDIAYAVTKLSQCAANPSQEHLDKARYILRYLAGTADYALVFDGASNKGLIAYTDSDYAGDPIKRRSITGYFFKLANGIISWQSRAQKTIALSSTEAEYMALSDCSRQAVWIKNIQTELGFKDSITPICADNEGGIFIANNPVQERRTKHIDVKYHHVRDLIEEKRIEIFWVPTDDNPADMFTKNLGHIKFLKFRSMLGLEFYSS